MKEAPINPESYQVNPKAEKKAVKRGEEINNSRPFKKEFPERDKIFNNSIYKKEEEKL